MTCYALHPKHWLVNCFHLRNRSMARSNKTITESLISKKPATAAKLFQEEMEQRLDELSKKTLGSYIHGVSNSLYHLGQERVEQNTLRREVNNAENVLSRVNGGTDKEMMDQQWKTNKRLNDIEGNRAQKERNRLKGLKRAVGKLTKEDLDEDQLNELSKNTLATYTRRAAYDLQ